MKVIYAFPEPLPLDRARGFQAVNTAAQLAVNGAEVLLAHVPVANTQPFEFYGIAQPAGAVSVSVARSLPWPFSRFHSNRFFFENLKRQFADDLLQSFLFVRHLKLAGLFARHLPAVEMAYEAHEVFGDTVPAARRDAVRSIESLVIAQARVVIANSSATADRLHFLYGRAGIKVIPNGVAWPERLPDKPWQDAQRHVVYAGSFFGWKGVHELISAGSTLNGFRIVMIGGGEEEAKRGQPPSGADMVFPGRLAHAKVMSWLAESCIAVLPNRNDTDSAFTSPIKLFEYMASGCAIVASDLPSIREILKDDEAVWVTPGDPAALAAGIRKLAADPVLARTLGSRVREKARLYTWEARGERLYRLLRSLRQR